MTQKRKKSIAFGTFDLIHPGHIYYLKEAKKCADELVVVVACDENVKEEKGEFPSNSEEERVEGIQSLGFVDRAILGDDEDKLKPIEQEKPDFICLGYDHDIQVDRLKQDLKNRGLEVEIKRIESLHPDRYSSYRLKKEFE